MKCGDPRLYAIRAFALVSTSIVAASCTGHGADPKSTASLQPMPTVATRPLACDLIPAHSVDLMFGSIPHKVMTLVRPTKNDDGSLASAKCKVVERDGNKDSLLDVTVSRGVDLVLVQSAAEQHARNQRYFPADLGPGIAQIRPGVDLSGNDRKTASAALQWGDYTIYTVINRDGRGRDLLRDVIAVTQQVGSALHLPMKPTSPYPHASPR